MTGSIPAADIFEQVRQAIARYAMLPPPGAEGVSVGVAVSGGADSVCLLEVLIALAAPLGLRLSDKASDLVAFMQWMGEPSQKTRVQIGVWVLLFLGLFTVIAWFLNRAYWKDIK